MAALYLYIFLFINLHIHPVFSAVPRYGTFNDATLLADNGFAPRWYMEGTPALPAQPLSPNPRHALSGYRLGARQDGNACPAGQHSCVEIDDAGMCCDNDRYCYLNATWARKCCPLGVKCPDSRCDADHLFCNATSSTTLGVGTTTIGDEISITSIVSVTTSTACCNRACTEASFSCEQAFGGQCCPYNYKCASGGSCIGDPAPSTSTSVSTIVTEIPSGCTTSQITCAQSLGGGCCNIGSTCTFQSVATASSKAVCAPAPTLSDSDSANTLSSGAKAGIGVGVAIGAAIVIAAVTWLCIRQRRQRPAPTATASFSAHEMRGNTVPDHATAVARSGVGDHDVGNSLLVGPMTPWSLRSGFSDPNDTPLSGHGHDYIGPDAVDGPFTDRDGDEHIVFNPGLATTPPAASGDGTPYFHPDHILRPVEIGAGGAREEVEESKEESKEDGHLIHAEETPAHDDDPTAGRFELMGSLGTPSPLNSDDPSQPTDKRFSASSPVGPGPK